MFSRVYIVTALAKLRIRALQITEVGAAVVFLILLIVLIAPGTGVPAIVILWITGGILLLVLKRTVVCPYCGSDQIPALFGRRIEKHDLDGRDTRLTTRKSCENDWAKEFEQGKL